MSARIVLMERVMYGLWVMLITGALMVVYLGVLVRASHRGEMWAIEALKAMACMNEGSSAAWFRMVEEPEQECLQRARRLVA
jgi:hypothetical protein